MRTLSTGLCNCPGTEVPPGSWARSPGLCGGVDGMGWGPGDTLPHHQAIPVREDTVGRSMPLLPVTYHGHSRHNCTVLGTTCRTRPIPKTHGPRNRLRDLTLLWTITCDRNVPSNPRLQAPPGSSSAGHTGCWAMFSGNVQTLVKKPNFLFFFFFLFRERVSL